MIMQNKLTTILLILALSVLFTSNVMAIGVSPGKITVAYDVDKGLEKSYSVLAISNSNEDSIINIEKSGELAEYIILEEKNMDILAGGVSSVNFSIIIPPDADFVGKHEAYIEIYESAPDEGGLIKVRSAVRMRLIVDFPFKGKYVEIQKFRIPGVNEEKNTKIEWSVLSRGLEPTTINSRIEIMNSENTTIFEKSWPSKNLAPKEKYVIEEELKTNQYSAGDYNARLFVTYEDIIREQTTEFKIGYENIKLVSYKPNNFTYGELNELTLEFENQWNGEFNNAFAEIKIKNVSAKTPSFKINPFGRAKVSQFINTKGLEPGEYEGQVTVNFDGRSSTEKINITIINPEEKQEISFIVVIIIIAILVLVSLIIIFIKKFKYQKQMPKNKNIVKKKQNKEKRSKK